MTMSPVYKKRIEIESAGYRGIAFQFGFGEKYMDRHRGTSIVFIMQVWRTVITVELFNHKPKKEKK